MASLLIGGSVLAKNLAARYYGITLRLIRYSSGSGKDGKGGKDGEKDPVLPIKRVFGMKKTPVNTLSKGGAAITTGNTKLNNIADSNSKPIPNQIKVFDGLVENMKLFSNQPALPSKTGSVISSAKNKLRLKFKGKSSANTTFTDQFNVKVNHNSKPNLKPGRKKSTTGKEAFESIKDFNGQLFPKKSDTIKHENADNILDLKPSPLKKKESIIKKISHNLTKSKTTPDLDMGALHGGKTSVYNLFKTEQKTNQKSLQPKLSKKQSKYGVFKSLKWNKDISAIGLPMTPDRFILNEDSETRKYTMQILAHSTYVFDNPIKPSSSVDTASYMIVKQKSSSETLKKDLEVNKTIAVKKVKVEDKTIPSIHGLFMKDHLIKPGGKINLFEDTAPKFTEDADKKTSCEIHIPIPTQNLPTKTTPLLITNASGEKQKSSNSVNAGQLLTVPKTNNSSIIPASQKIGIMKRVSNKLSSKTSVISIPKTVDKTSTSGEKQKSSNSVNAGQLSPAVKTNDSSIIPTPQKVGIMKRVSNKLSSKKSDISIPKTVDKTIDTKPIPLKKKESLIKKLSDNITKSKAKSDVNLVTLPKEKTTKYNLLKRERKINQKSLQPELSKKQSKYGVFKSLKWSTGNSAIGAPMTPDRFILNEDSETRKYAMQILAHSTYVFDNPIKPSSSVDTASYMILKKKSSSEILNKNLEVNKTATVAKLELVSNATGENQLLPVVRTNDGALVPATRGVQKIPGQKWTLDKYVQHVVKEAPKKQYLPVENNTLLTKLTSIGKTTNKTHLVKVSNEQPKSHLTFSKKSALPKATLEKLAQYSGEKVDFSLKGRVKSSLQRLAKNDVKTKQVKLASSKEKVITSTSKSKPSVPIKPPPKDGGFDGTNKKD